MNTKEFHVDIMGIYALGAALDLLFEIGIDKIERTVLELGDLIIGKAEKRDFTVKTPTAKEERGGIVSIVGNFNPIDIKNKLKNMDIIVNVRDNAIRISPHFYNTEDEIFRLFNAIDMLTQ